MPNNHTTNTEPIKLKPLTLHELHKTQNRRVFFISKEFTDGFNFLRKYPKSVTIFGSARSNPNSTDYLKAKTLSERIVKELHYSIITGGGPGIMEAANRGAFEAKGDSLGVSIELPHTQVNNMYLTENIGFTYFFSRKVCLAFAAEAYIFFPGGFGTLDEFFEIITLVQTEKITPVPVILFDSGFWKPLDNFMQKELLEKGRVDAGDLQLYTITDDEDEIMNIIRNAPIRNGIEFEH